MPEPTDMAKEIAATLRADLDDAVSLAVVYGEDTTTTRAERDADRARAHLSWEAMNAHADAQRAHAFAADQVGAPDGMVALRLVPVEVFGTESCCEHGHSPALNGIECESGGYGLMDVTGAGSDCNRARGHIFRVDDLPNRQPAGGNVVVYVREADVPFLTETVWGSD